VIKIKVALLYYTEDMEKYIVSATKSCKSEKSAAELFKKNFTQKNLEKTIEELLNVGHMSPFEFGEFIFSVEGVSRQLTHQYVRHRIASYLQQSLRSVKPKGYNFIVPPKLIESKNLGLIIKYIKQQKEAFDLYREAIELGLNEEDARTILPIGVKTNIVCKMNARELLQNFFYLRCCQNAQWEINMLAYTQLLAVKIVSPKIFENAGPSCIFDGKCKDLINAKLKSREDSKFKHKCLYYQKCFKETRKKVEKINRLAEKLRKEFVEKGHIAVDLTKLLGYKAPKNIKKAVSSAIGEEIDLDYKVFLEISP